MEILLNQLLEIIGQKEVECYLLRQRLADLEAQSQNQRDETDSKERT